MYLLSFLDKPEVKIKYSTSQYVDMANAVITVADILKMPVNSKLINSVPLENKLVGVCLVKLATRLQAKPILSYQRDVKMRFHHEEALAFLVTMNGTAVAQALTVEQKMAVQFTLNQLHKHYI